MTHLTINSLSLCGQYATLHDLEAALAEVVECLNTSLFALKHEAVILWFDGQIEDRVAITGGATLRATINKFDRDLRQKWFLYTRNHAAAAEGELVDIEVRSAGTTQSVAGMACNGPLLLRAQWISFGGIPVFASDEVIVTVAATGERFLIGNANSVAAYREWWPRFEPSPKHQKTGYHARSGEWVSPMPLSDKEAQEALDISQDVNGERVAVYKGRRFRFMRTHPNRNIYHGFEPSDPP